MQRILGALTLALVTACGQDDGGKLGRPVRQHVRGVLSVLRGAGVRRTRRRNVQTGRQLRNPERTLRARSGGAGQPHLQRRVDLRDSRAEPGDEVRERRRRGADAGRGRTDRRHRQRARHSRDVSAIADSLGDHGLPPGDCQNAGHSSAACAAVTDPAPGAQASHRFPVWGCARRARPRRSSRDLRRAGLRGHMGKRDRSRSEQRGRHLDAVQRAR